MKVKDVIFMLQKYNPDANVSVIAHNKEFDFTFTFGNSEGVEKENCETVGFYVDDLSSAEEEWSL